MGKVFLRNLFIMPASRGHFSIPKPNHHNPQSLNTYYPNTPIP